MNSSVFLNSKRLCSDDCAKEARDVQNQNIEKYELYQYLPIECDGKNARFPGFAYDHVNLRGRIGYGQSEGCVVDRFSLLRNDPNQLTRDRCKIQLFSRIFQGGPNLKPGVVDPGQEMPIIQGQSSTTLEGTKYPCKKPHLAESGGSRFMPMLDCIKDVQDPRHIVEPWIRGGDDTRSIVRRKEWMNKCDQSYGRAMAAPL